MDSVFPPVRREHHRPSPPPVLSSDSDRFLEVTPPPPPRNPLRRLRTDTDAPSPCRPCPPPPVPAREPLGRSRNAAAEPARQPPTTALDSVVPLSHWPLRSVGPQPTVENPSHISLNDCVRRGHPTLPVNVMVVPTAPTTVNHASPPVAAPPPPKTCANGRGNVYVDSPTVNRSNAVVGLTPLPTITTDRPTLTECRGSLLQPPSNQRASSPTVKFNPVVESNGGGTGGLAGSEKQGGVVTGQPRSTDAGVCRGGIRCQRCGRCRCANCTAPRELPRRWVGDCELSIQRCVSVTSCLCCVEALFYHCLDGADADDGGGAGAADDPCACCERPRCCLRWSLMAALATTVLPCLCCYCPLQCAADALTACYNVCATPRGCRCRGATHEASSGSSTRGLLAESESSST